MNRCLWDWSDGFQRRLSLALARMAFRPAVRPISRLGRSKVRFSPAKMRLGSHPETKRFGIAAMQKAQEDN